MARSVEHKVVELYLSNLELIGEGFPAAINRRRNPFIEELRLGSLPGKGDERYHLTDIAELYSRDWEYYFTPPPHAGVPLCGGTLDEGPCYRVAVYNGFTDSELHTEEDGVVYGSLRAAATQYEEIVAQYYGSAADTAAHPTAGLNTAFAQDGVFVHIPEGVRAEKPFVLDFGYVSAREAVACFSRLLVVAGKGSAAQLLVAHRGDGGAAVLANHVGEIVAGDGALLEITEFSCLNAKSTLLHGGFVRQEAQSRTDITAVCLSAQAARVSYKISLAGVLAETRLAGLHISTATERKDFYLHVDHLAPECISRESVKGVVAGQAVGSFTGRVYVAPGAQKTEALQQSRNIELSQGAKIYTRPQLEIYADDVKCSHGATVGQLDAEAVYYMRQRGIDLQTARRLQLEGFITDVTQREGYGRRLIDELVQNKIAQL